MLRSILLASLMAGACLNSYAQGDTWTQHGDWVSSAIQSCKDETGDTAACREFSGQALDRLLGTTEFCADAGCMLMADIEASLRNTPERWQLIGGASDQGVLDKARDMVAAGRIVVAAQRENALGQIAILMPGSAVPSGKWGMDRVPVAAAARPDAPEKSVYAEGINWVFSEPSKVMLYSRR
jgi:hypothetical protein